MESSALHQLATMPGTLTHPLTMCVLSGADELIALDFSAMNWPRTAAWPGPPSEYGRKIFPSPWLLQQKVAGGDRYEYKCITCPDLETAKKLSRFTGTIANSTQINFSFKDCSKIGSTLQHIAHGGCQLNQISAGAVEVLIPVTDFTASPYCQKRISCGNYTWLISEHTNER